MNIINYLEKENEAFGYDYIVVHYAKLNRANILELEFNNFAEFYGYLLADSTTEPTAYLVSIFDEIFITSRIAQALNFVSGILITNEEVLIKDCELEIFFQEYESFESAYKVALDMMASQSEITYTER